MNRRNFLKASLIATALTGGAAYGPLVSRVMAAGSGVAIPRTLVHTMLEGGADLRYAMVPAPDFDATYVDTFWAVRSPMYKGSYSDYEAMFADQYTQLTDPDTGFKFGLHKSCGWLAEQFSSGNVAIIANVYGSLNRRHDHSQLIVNTGDLNTDRLDINHNGWGGRLIEAINGSSNVLSISGGVSQFCKGSDAGNRLAQVFHARDMRNIALPEVIAAKGDTDPKNVLTRALKAYYDVRGAEIDQEGKPANWPFRQFFNNYNSLQEFGDPIKGRLDTLPLPSSVADMTLNDDTYALQCRNLYDSCLVADILDARVIAMEYLGWDSHAIGQKTSDSNLGDIFGAGAGLDTVTTQLAIDSPGGADNLVYAFSSDFGRQFTVNILGGTEHGSASSSIIVGNAVNGGVYGELFPLRESQPDPDDALSRPPLEIEGQDILGLTSFERVLSEVCDWVEPGTGVTVFPDAASSDLEDGVDLGGLFSV